MAFLGQEEQLREYQDRFKYFRAIIIILGAIILARLVYLQILLGDRLRLSSEENRIKRVKIVAPRGMIFDRNRTLLLDNRPAFDLEVIPQYLYGSKRTDEVIQRISLLLNLPEETIKSTLKKRRRQPTFLPIVIKKDLTRDEVALIEAWKLELPGVSVEMKSERTNLYGDTGTHLLGYVREINASELKLHNKEEQRYSQGDSIGKSGIELEMESQLKGEDGIEIIEVDALGRRVRKQTLKRNPSEQKSEIPVVPGNNLILTIDQDLQLAAVKAFEGKVGAAIALDPRSGEVLAMVSRPSFNPSDIDRVSNFWGQLINNEDRPLRDKVIQDHYSPGSTFKAITAITALEEGVINENTYFTCTGSFRLGNRVYHCHKKGGHGTVNIVSALAQSCNVFFYRTAQKLESVDLIAKWAKKFGFGQRTGIQLAREIPGLIPTEAWKQQTLNQVWTAGETLSVAIGQSFVLTTLMQLAHSYATIANGGTRYKPFVIKRIESANNTVIREFTPQILEQAHLSEKTKELVIKGLWKVINDPTGTAYRRRIEGADFAGKTGTVQLSRVASDKIHQRCDTRPYRQRHHGLFVGFAPAQNPVIAIAVIGEHACSGSGGAAPIAQAIVYEYLKKYYPQLINKPMKLEEIARPQVDEPVVED